MNTQSCRAVLSARSEQKIRHAALSDVCARFNAAVFFVTCCEQPRRVCVYDVLLWPLGAAPFWNVAYQ